MLNKFRFKITQFAKGIVQMTTSIWPQIVRTCPTWDYERHSSDFTSVFM